MKKYFLSFLFVSFFSAFSFSQCGAHVDAGDDITIGCTTDCTTLVADIGVGAMGDGSDTSEYIILNDYCLPDVVPETATGITSDDDWTGIVDIGFSFGFFENVYNQILIGDNGVLTFELADAGGYCPWAFDETAPDPNLPVNAIFGAYHDLYTPAASDPGSVISYYTAGEAPFRIFVVNYEEVPQFSCNELLTTQQIILYETSNIVVVNVTAKPICDSWQDGAALIGIQNKSGTIAYVPGAATTPDGDDAYPERNTSVPSWEVVEPESWQFIPANLVSPDVTFTWYDGITGEVLGSDPEGLDVCPTETTPYVAEVAVGDFIPLTDFVTVTVIPSAEATVPDNMTMCSPTGDGIATFDLDSQTDIIAGSVTGATISYYLSLDDADSETAPLVSPYTTGATTIYARLDTDDSACYDVITFELMVENITATDASMTSCSEAGETTGVFELTDVEATIVGTETDATISYYETEADAIAGSSALSSTLYTTATTVIYARLENSYGCSDIASIDLTVNISPQVYSATLEPVCNEGLGIGNFDLTTAFSDVVGDQTGVTASFHISEDDAINNVYPLSEEEDLTSQTIFVRIDRGACTTYGEFNIEVENCPPSIPNTFTPNADGKNDTFDIKKLQNVYDKYKLTIYNRWGNIVYEEENGDTDAGWDGVVDGLVTNDPSGTTYFYVLELNDGVNDPVEGWVFVKP